MKSLPNGVEPVKFCMQWGEANLCLILGPLFRECNPPAGFAHGSIFQASWRSEGTSLTVHFVFLTFIAFPYSVLQGTGPWWPILPRAGKNPIFFHYKIGFLVLMNKTRFSLYKTWFYFGVGQALGHPHPCHAHIDTTSSSSDFRHWCCTAARKQGTTIADAGLWLRHCDKGKIECQTLVINITAINKPIKTRLWHYPGTRVLFKNRIKPNWIKPDTASPDSARLGLVDPDLCSNSLNHSRHQRWAVLEEPSSSSTKFFLESSQFLFWLICKF